MDESTVAMATADVMVYDDATKRWVAPDGCAEPARSQVRILHNTHTNAFRIVGTRLQDRQWILNCNVYERLKYNPATPLFHQWRDEKRKVYGLSFLSEEEARLFINVMTRALALLATNNDYQNGSAFGNSNGVYHEPQQLHHAVHSEPLFRDNDQDSICSAGMPANVANNYRKSSHSVHSSASMGMSLASTQRRASQGSSSSSSNGSSGPTMVYAPTSAATSSCSPMRAAPPVDAPAAVSSNAPPAPPLPPGGLAPVSSNAPPAPPPPPPLGGLASGKSNATSIADQIKNFQLKKTNNASNAGASSTPKADAPTGGRGRGALSLVSELEATLNKRKNFVENGDTRSVGEPASNGVAKRAWERPSGAGLLTNANSGSTESPKMHRNVNRAPSGSSLSSQEEPRPAAGVIAAAGSSNTTAGVTRVTVEMLEKWKIEVLNEVREEISRAKNEILEAIRAERK